MVETRTPEDFRLGQELVRSGLLSEAQMRTSLEYQQSLGGRLVDIARKLGFVDETRLNDFVARREHINTIDLADRVIDVDLMRKIPRDVIEGHEVIPFRQSETSILLAMSEAMDYEAIEEIQFLTSCTIETALAPRSQVLAAIARFYDENPQWQTEPGAAHPGPTVQAETEHPEPGSSEISPPEPSHLVTQEPSHFVTQDSLTLAPESGAPAGSAEAADSPAATPPTPSLQETLLAQVQDPAVAALARALLKSGVLDPESWERELEGGSS